MIVTPLLSLVNSPTASYPLLLQLRLARLPALAPSDQRSDVLDGSAMNRMMHIRGGNSRSGWFSAPHFFFKC